MIYSATITTSANTAKADAVKTFLKVTKGLAWLIEVDFPPGCCGGLHVQIFDGSYQVLPATPGESLHGDGVTARFDDLYLKQGAPFEFHILTWNLGEDWSHTIQVRVGVASERAFMSRYMPTIAWEDFERLLAEAAAGQEALRAEQLEELLKEIMGE